METGKKFVLADVVEKLCAGIREKKRSQSNGTFCYNSNKVYKTKDKWMRLTAQLPQAVIHCMQGIVTMFHCNAKSVSVMKTD